MDQQVVMPMDKTGQFIDKFVIKLINAGWFDAFRDHGAPTWYGDNRTPVVTDTTTMLIVMSFTVAFIAFLVILPGLRKHVSLFGFLCKFCRDYHHLRHSS